MAHNESSDDPPEAPPRRELPDLATRITESQELARKRRVELGLPPDADDGGYNLRKRKPRKHAPKRAKNHGQFLGTVADSWNRKD